MMQKEKPWGRPGLRGEIVGMNVHIYTAILDLSQPQKIVEI